MSKTRSHEMSDPISFTLDLEDHRPDSNAEMRYPRVVEGLLDDLDEWGVCGTVFVVGEVAGQSPELVREIAARGHEIGLHGADHTPLTHLSPQQLREGAGAAAESLAELAGAPISGFRAPIFSLVPDSSWAPEILTELGFEYSSSVLPARNPLFGWPGAPREPFRWPCGLVELPVPVMGFGLLRMPLLGGTYLRAAPSVMVRWARRQARHHRAPWLYAHPYDFDPGEPRWVVPEAGRLGSLLLWHGRRSMSDRVQSLVENADQTLRDTARQLQDLPVFDPAQPKPSTRPARTLNTQRIRPRMTQQGQTPQPEQDLTHTGGHGRTAQDAHALTMENENNLTTEDNHGHSAQDENSLTAEDEYSTADMIHRLPRARLVDRADFIVESCRGQRVIHVGFADAGFRREQQRAGNWLHARIGACARELVGIDTDSAGVAEARSYGWDAHVADCTDPDAVEALGLAPADVVVAGEVIEHVTSPGALLDGMRHLCRDDGRLIVTTPNGAGIINSLAVLLRGVELMHPDHVVVFTPRTLSEMLRRQGWQAVEHAVYLPTVGSRSGSTLINRLALRTLLAIERLATHLGRPFAAEGLIAVAKPDLKP